MEQTSPTTDSAPPFHEATPPAEAWQACRDRLLCMMAHAFTFDYLPSEDLMELQPGLQDPACPAQPSRIPAYLASFDETRANVVCADSAATVKNALAAADAGS